MNKRIYVSGLIVVLLFLFISPVMILAEEGEQEKDDLNLAPNAKSAILMERDTGEILFEKNPHEKLPPASMTKIMTMLLIMESIDKGELALDEKIRISERAASMGGSQIFLAAGEEMTVENLLKGIAMASGNDASVALAERIAGSEEAFVKKMNEKVRELNLKNSHFDNSSGLPGKKHYSTSYDMAIIAKELLKYETITDFTSIYDDYLRKGQKNEFWLVNTNKLVRFYPGVDGLKTGYTNEAKYCLTATAKKGDMRVITVVMGSESSKERNATTSQMLDYAFNHFETKKLYEKGDAIKTISHLKAKSDQIKIVASESISVLYKKGESIDDIKTTYKIEPNLTLPIKKGDKVGTLTIKSGDNVISETKLTVEKEVEKASYFTLLKRSAKYLVKLL